jgi:hypothetical protein
MRARNTRSRERADEDVTGMGLIDDVTVGATHIDQLDDVKAARAADDIRYLAFFELRRDFLEQRGQLAPFTPTEIAPLQRLLAVGLGSRRAAEIRPGLQPGDDVFRFVFCLGQLLGRGAVGNGHQDVPQPVFRILAALLVPGGEKVVDVPVGDLNAILYLSLLHPGLDELLADFFAKGREYEAVAF